MPSTHSIVLKLSRLPPAAASLKLAGLEMVLLCKDTLHMPDQGLFLPADLLQYLVFLF